jgi:hypothetical protein
MKWLMLLLVGSLFAFGLKPKADFPILKSADSIAVEGGSFAVLELFTSEGCSSCPSADELLSTIKNKEGVFPLSFHVSYWNKLGWKDEFSALSFDRRQYLYSQVMQLDGVYTPQLVVNGTAQLVGSEKSKVNKAIEAALSEKATAGISLRSVLKDSTEIDVQYDLKGDFEGKDLQVVLVEQDLVVKVKRGENGGRTLKHDNVVRDFQTVDVQKTAKGGLVLFPLSKVNLKHSLVIAYLQDKKTLKIVAAAKVKL